MERLTAEGGFDIVYLVVSPQNPFKSSESVLTAEERYLDAVEAVSRHPGLKVKVDDIELRMDPPSYTIRTLDALREREPWNEFTLVIGADNLAGLSRWRDFRRILSDYGVVVYPREGFDLEETRNALLADQEGGDFKIRLIDAPKVDISSTRIREGEAAGEDMSAWRM